MLGLLGGLKPARSTKDHVPVILSEAKDLKCDDRRAVAPVVVAEMLR